MPLKYFLKYFETLTGIPFELSPQIRLEIRFEIPPQIPFEVFLEIHFKIPFDMHFEMRVEKTQF